jgi:hypothetical protein
MTKINDRPYSSTDSHIEMDDQTVVMLQSLAHLMDKAFTIPGTNIKMGLDSIIGLIPGIGDTIAVGISAYIYSFAKKANVPWHLRTKMLWNIFIDWLIGLIPLIGDIFDIGWKANSRNIKIITDYYEKQKNADIIDGQYTKAD